MKFVLPFRLASLPVRFQMSNHNGHAKTAPVPPRKPRVALKDPNTLSTDNPIFSDAKAAMGKPCAADYGTSSDGREFENITGHVMAVDSRPFKGGRDAIYVGIKSPLSEFLIYTEFRLVRVLGNVGQPVVIPRSMKT